MRATVRTQNCNNRVVDGVLLSNQHFCLLYPENALFCVVEIVVACLQDARCEGTINGKAWQVARHIKEKNRREILVLDVVPHVVLNCCPMFCGELLFPMLRSKPKD